MKSKISCFNKTIFKKNFTQFWPLWAAYLFIMILMMPVTLYQEMQRGYYAEKPYIKQLYAVENVLDMSTEPILLFLFGTLAVMAVFSYLYTSKNANGIHALPVTRLELFVTNFLSAFGNLAIINILVFIITVFVGIGCGVTNIDILFYALLMQLGMLFFATAFSTCIAMLTGHIMAMPIYCGIANILYVAVCYLLMYFVATISYGMSADWEENVSYVLSPLYYLSSKVDSYMSPNKLTNEAERIIVEGGGVVAGYAVAAIFVLILAYQLYKRRQVETAGDIIAVGFMKPILRIGSCICIGFAGGMILTDFLFDYVDYSNEVFVAILCCSIFCGVIAFFGAEMLMQKNFRVFKKRIVIEAAAALGVMMLAAGVVKADALGLEKNLPAKDEIICAYTDFNYILPYEGEELEVILDIHEQIIAAKEENLRAYANDEATRSIRFLYYLEDGTSFSRRYQIPVNEDDPFDETMISAQIATREADGVNMAKHIFGNNYETNGFLSGYIYRYDEYDNSYDYRFSEEELQVVGEALMKDILDGNFTRYQLYSYKSNREDEFVNHMEFVFYNENGIEYDENIYWQGLKGGSGADEYVIVETAQSSVAEIQFESHVDTNSVYLDFGKQCVHTIKALEELGIINDDWKLYTRAEWEALRENQK